MGLGPSIKMTTRHHFFCPVTEELGKQTDLEFAGIIVDGVSEVCDDKIYTAKRTADLAKAIGADGAVVAIDGWGNHHVDFVNVIEQLGIRGIPSVGLSYIGQQGRLVCSNSYVDCVIDFNKSISGYESCVVGQNNLMDYDAIKAVALLKNKMKKNGKWHTATGEPVITGRLLRREYAVREVRFGERTEFTGGILTIQEGIEQRIMKSDRIREIRVRIVKPGEHDIFVNSNLDYFPIACKVRGESGTGETRVLTGVTVMLTGVEETGFQPSNIGSSEGTLAEQTVFDREGTPGSQDYLLHIDVLFCDGEGRTSEGIRDAHRAADQIVNRIRNEMKKPLEMPYVKKECADIARPGASKVVLVKIVSGLGNMYETAMFPEEPGGVLGAHFMMDSKNLPYVITPNQCRDGVIHSLL